MPDLNQRIWETSAVAARQYTEASSRAFISSHNEDLTRIYLADVFKPWADGVRNGSTTNANPPKPPMAYELAPPDANGFVFYQIGTTPVCSIPAVPPNAAVNAVTHALAERVNVPAGDTRKPGETASGAQLIALGANAEEIGDPKSFWGLTERPSFGSTPYRWYQRIE